MARYTNATQKETKDLLTSANGCDTIKWEGVEGDEGRKSYLQNSLGINQTKEDARGEIRADAGQ